MVFNYHTLFLYSSEINTYSLFCLYQFIMLTFQYSQIYFERGRKQMQSNIIMTITKNSIDVAVREEYDSGRVYGCYFLVRYGTYKQFRLKLLRSRIPVCSHKELKKYIGEQTRLLSEIWHLNPPKKQK